MGHGGKRLGAGRPKGAQTVKARNNKKTRAQTGETIERALKNGDVTPLETMLRNLRVIVAKAEEMLEAGVAVTDRDHLALRKMAQEFASVCAPYCHPRLSAIANLTPPVDPHADQSRKSVDEFIARIERLAAANVVQLEPMRGNGTSNRH